MTTQKLMGIGLFLLAVFVAVPVLIAVSGRWDFYYTLTSVALLSVASAGVWLTFYIGRINIGQGAYALVGGYVSAILMTQAGVSFWATLPIAGLFCALISVGIGLPILRLRGVYFAMVTLVLTEVARLTALALPVTNGAKGITSIPLPGELSIFGLTIIPDFATMQDPKLAFYLLAVLPDGGQLPRPVADRELAAWVTSAARCSRTRNWLPPSASTPPICGCWPMRSRPSSAASPGRCSSPSRSRSTRRPSRSPTA
jgi:hypothetical protein